MLPVFDQFPQGLLDRFCLTIGRRWFKAGSTSLICLRNKALAQDRVNAYRLFHLYIYRPLEYERVYLPLFKMADTPFHIQGGDILTFF